MNENRTIKCLMHYDNPKLSHQKRAYHLAAATKADYVFDVFNRLGYDVLILSASRSKTVTAPAKTIRINKNTTLQLLYSFGRGNAVKNKISTLFFMIQYYIKCICSIKRDDVVWVYHSLPFISLLNLLKRIKKFTLILEVEEIYGDVINSKKTKKKESEMFQHSDAFIFPSYLLEEQFNYLNRPFAISHGTYRNSGVNGQLFQDGKIHVLYAGTLDKRMGSRLAINASLYLSNEYCIHIIGGGTDEEIKEVKTMVDQVNSKNLCRVFYDGILTDKEYLEYVSSCQIGLCPHDPKESFNETSFPSKILSYMTNGLSVVSIKINNIVSSDVNDYMTYYEENTPQALAEAIKSVSPVKRKEISEAINKLDNKFCNEVKNVLTAFTEG